MRVRVPVAHRHKGAHVQVRAQSGFERSPLLFGKTANRRTSANFSIVLPHHFGPARGNQLRESLAGEECARKVDNVRVAEKVIEERFDSSLRIGSAQLKQDDRDSLWTHGSPHRSQPGTARAIRTIPESHCGCQVALWVKIAQAQIATISLRAIAASIDRYPPATSRCAAPPSPRTKRTRPTPPSRLRIDSRSFSFHPRFPRRMRNFARSLGVARFGTKSQLVKFRAQPLQPVTICDQDRCNAQHGHKRNQEHFTHYRIES